MRGDWLADFEQLVAFSDREIPPGDAILMLPGEDLFYFTTGRTPQFPVLLLDNTVNPYSAAQLAHWRGSATSPGSWSSAPCNCRRSQSRSAPTLELLAHDFARRRLDNYEIYRRNQN